MDKTEKLELSATLQAVNSAKLELEKLNEQQSDILFSISNLKPEKEKLELEIDRLTEINNKKLSENKLISTTLISELEGLNHEKNSKFLMLDKSIKEMEVKIKNLESEKKNLENLIPNIKNQLTKLDGLIADKENKLVGMNQEADKITIAAVNAQKKQNEDLEKYNKLKTDLETEIHTNIKTSEKLKDDISLLGDRFKKLSSDKDTLAGEIPALNSEISKLRNEKEIEAANVLKLREEGLLLVKKHLYIEAKEKELLRLYEKAGWKY